jgi:UDP-N-acetylmuramoyl-L-alanyl-D-glutamate--2,6-diaminopimelate ligase
MIGEFNVENILCATATGSTMGIGKKAIEDGINLCRSIPGRMETFSLRSGGKAIVDYAHTPDAYEKVLSAIKELMIDSKAKIYIVFGCGGDRDRSKRSVMAAIAEQYATHSFVTPDNPRNEKIPKINEEIVSGFKNNNFDVFTDREKGLRAALDMTVKNDIVIVLGKGREEYQEICGELISYSDINIINEYSHEN